MAYSVILDGISAIWKVILSAIVRKKVHMSMCLIMNSNRNRAALIYKYRSTETDITYCSCNFNFIFKCQICYTKMTKSVTVHNNCSKIPQSTSTHFATRVRRSRVVRLSWSSRFFMRQAASKLQASYSSRVHLSFVRFVLHPTPKQNFKLMVPCIPIQC